MSAVEAMPKPHNYLYGEAGGVTSWLASCYSPAEIRDEWDYLFENGAKLSEVWLTLRWTTPEELANGDWMFDQFGDVEMDGTDTSVVYTPVKAGTTGAHCFWTVPS